MPSYNIILFQGYDWKCGDASTKVVISDTSKILSANLQYSVVGYWRTGLESVKVNGITVKSYPLPVWPQEDVWKGTDSVDIKGQLVSGENFIYFSMVSQAIFCSILGSGQLTANLVLVTSEPVNVTPPQPPISGVNVEMILILIVIFLIFAVMMR